MKSKIIVLVLACTLSATAAPLLDGPDWARDAVSSLAAQGLIEGYPAGTFKGDRSASRWEVATLVARLLAKMESGQGSLLNRQQLELVRRLAEELKPELDRLGTRVTSVEENLVRLDQRVYELERINFYGRFESRFVDQSFSNTGAGDNDIGRQGHGPRSSIPFTDYNQAVGTLVGSKIRPQTNGVVPVVDYTNGRALTNGAGFTSLAVLGVRAALGADWTAEMELAAFSSQGNSVVNSFWGVSAPYLSNPFTANAAGADLANSPFTRMTLDHVRLEHKPSKTVIVLGTLPQLLIDPIVYAGQTNNGVYGPKRFPGYGFMVRGEVPFNETDRLRWEVFESRFGNGVVYQTTNYQNSVWGGDVGYEFAHGYVRFNFAHMAEDAPEGGGPLAEGYTSGLNVPYGNSTGWTVRQWVNPPGYFANQRSSFKQGATGKVVNGVFQPNTVDTRPIVGWNGAADNSIGITTGAGDYGPEEQSAWGLSGRYKFDLDRDAGHSLRFSGEWAESTYKSNKNSSYQSQGSMLRGELEASFWKDRLVFDLSFLRGDPNYQPAGWNSDVSGLRSPITGNYVGSFHLYDNQTYRHNRTGPKGLLKWNFDEGHGFLSLQAHRLEQTQTSLYDVRSTVGSAGPGAPNYPVIGFSPGFIENIFWGYATPYQYGPKTANSFTNDLQPMEDPRGSESNLGFTVSYKWDEPRVDVTLRGERNHYLRKSILSPGLGGSQNEVDFHAESASLLVGWQIDDRLKLRAGLDYVITRGHLDPAGLYNRYAIATNSINFANIGSEQWIPNLGFEYQISKDSQADITVRHFNTRDLLGSDVFGGLVADSVGLSAHPFSWQGWQLSTGYSMKF